MEIARWNDNWNKVSTKEELLELLKKSSVILNRSMEEYLISLIELEFSVVREFINLDERKALSELEIYQKVAIYNIYNRAIELFRNNNIPVDIQGNNNGFESLTISYPYFDGNIKLFDFDYSKPLNLNNKIPSGYESRKIGNVALFQSLESKELRAKELDSIMLKLEQLYDARNPYPNTRRPHALGPHIGGPHATWAHEHYSEIRKYERLFTELDNKKELTDEDKKEIEITNEAYNLLLEDYGLTTNDFNETKPITRFGCSHQSKMQKTLVKKMPNLTISTNIKYI